MQRFVTQNECREFVEVVDLGDGLRLDIRREVAVPATLEPQRFQFGDQPLFEVDLFDGIQNRVTISTVSLKFEIR